MEDPLGQVRHFLFGKSNKWARVVVCGLCLVINTAPSSEPPEQAVVRRPLMLDTALSGVVSGVEESVNARLLG